jgi:hypothetical protein
MKLAIVGSRTFADYFLLWKTLQGIQDVSLVVSGGAQGADTLAERWAKNNNIPVKVFLPEWDVYGKSAGFIRNELIINEADMVLAFWDGVSKGTKHSIDLAEKAGKKCIITYFTKEAST